MDNRFNEVFSSFDLFNKEFAPSSWLIDIFSSQFSFYLSSKQSNKSDASNKNYVTTFILHIHVHNKSVIKTLHHTVNVTTTEAKLFTIRCSINQATNLNSINKIIIITDSIHAIKKIFDPSLHPLQIHVASISDKLRKFFIKNHNNSIEFWKYSSYCEWPLHKGVDKETKKFYPKLYYPCKSLLWQPLDTKSNNHTSK